MPHTSSVRCLILACGNPLRGDDGLGLWLAAWAEDRFRAEAGVRVMARQQWTPELAQDISQAASVLFVDASVACSPGAIQIASVDPTLDSPVFATHHLSARQLLGLCSVGYGRVPRKALLFTVGIDSVDLGETLSDTVEALIPQAQALIETAVSHLLEAERAFKRRKRIRQKQVGATTAAATDFFSVSGQDV